MKSTLKFVVAAGVATVVASGVSFAQYGLPPPAQAPPVTGFTEILTSELVGPSGGILRARLQEATVVLRIPAGSFSSPLQVTMTAPRRSSYSSLRSCLALVGADVAVAVGVEAKTEGGSTVRGRLGTRPLTLSVLHEAITAEWDVARSQHLEPIRYVPMPNAVVRDGLARARFNRAGAFLVITPQREARASEPRLGCSA
jgi:hypothetical protein